MHAPNWVTTFFQDLRTRIFFLLTTIGVFIVFSLSAFLTYRQERVLKQQALETLAMIANSQSAHISNLLDILSRQIEKEGAIVYSTLEIRNLETIHRSRLAPQTGDRSYLRTEFDREGNSQFSLFVQGFRTKKWIRASLNINRLFLILTDREGLGSTGETFIIGPQFRLLSPSRFTKSDEPVFMKSQESILSLSENPGRRMVKNEHFDYRGVRVLSAGTRIEHTDWILIAKMDLDEALRPLSVFRFAAWSTSILVFFIGLGIIFYLDRIIFRPLKAISENATELGAKPQVIIPFIQERHEIGRLSQALHNMANQIQERIKTEAWQKELNEAVVNHVPAAIALCTWDLAILKANHRFARLFQGEEAINVNTNLSLIDVLKNSELTINDSHNRSIGIEDFCDKAKLLLKNRGAESGFTFRLVPPSFTPKKLLVSLMGIQYGLTPMDNRLLLFCDDVTQTERLRGLIEDSERQFESVLQQAMDGILIVSSSGKVSFANEVCLKTFGYSLTEFIGRSLTDFMPNKYRVMHTAGLKRFVEEGVSQSKLPFTGNRIRIDGLKKDGTEFPIELSIGVQRTNEGIIFIGVLRDITQELKNTQQMRLQRAALESSALAIYIVTKSGSISWVNRAFSELTGYSESDVLGKSPGILKSGIHDDAFYKTLWTTILSGRSWKGEVTNRNKSGTLYPYEVTITPVKNEQGEITHFVAIGENISAKKQYELQKSKQQSELAHTSKLVALGEMAGGIAHEINNPLGAISLFTETLEHLISQETIDHAKTKEIISRILSTSTRIAKIVKGLRSFARDSDSDPFTTTQVSEIIEDTLSFCNEKFKQHSIDLQIENDGSEIKIDCRSTQISQVLLNLLNNAHDAIEGLPNKWVTVSVRDLGGKCEISVTDSGSGLSKAIQEKLFQPFFTTKGVGKGTGLGLSISRGILESHQGSLTIDESCPNTRFVLSIPKHRSEAEFTLKRLS